MNKVEKINKKSKERMKRTILIVQSVLIFIFFVSIIFNCQASIPAKFDGFVYKNNHGDSDSIVIEAFFDPVCPDSRDAWPPLKQILRFYHPRVSLIVHPFPLPYHDNSFITSRALHIVNKLNSSATYGMMESFFEKQEMFYNQQTWTMSRARVEEEIVMFVTKEVGNSYYSSVEAGFKDRKTDLSTRVSFKYGCSRGVIGTPFFIVNGFALPDAGSAIDYKGWRSIIDPLVRKKGVYKEDYLHYFI